MSVNGLIASLAIALVIVACSDDPAGPRVERPAAASLELNVDSIALYPGESVQLRATVLDSAGAEIDGAETEWSTLDATVVEIDSTGRIEAIGHGATQVTVRLGALELDVPVRVTQFVQVSGIGRSLCALDVEGHAWCRGLLNRGFLGPDHLFVDEFRQLPHGLVFSELAVGAWHACGIAGGETYCWGDDEDGKLGRGAALTFTHDTVFGGVTFVSLSAGYDHTCALDAEGRAYCWGRPWEGQLGRGSADSIGMWEAGIPDTVFGGHRWTALDAGWDNTCGVATDGVTYCWGTLLGDQVPTPVAGMPGEGDVVSGDGFVACGGAGTSVHCQSGYYGRPDYAFTGSVTLPALATALSSYRTYACATVTGGDTWCWGPDAGEFLGNGTLAGSDVPVRVLSDEVFVDVIAGGERACGLTQQGGVHCWGADVWDSTRWTGGEASAIPLRIEPPRP